MGKLVKISNHLFISHGAWLMHQKVKVSANQLNKNYSFTFTLQNKVRVKTLLREMQSGKQKLPETVVSRLSESICLKCHYLLS